MTSSSGLPWTRAPQQNTLETGADGRIGEPCPAERSVSGPGPSTLAARIAKAAGTYRGRAKLLNPDKVDLARELVDQGVPKSRVAARLGVHRSTLQRALAQQVSACA